MIDKLDLRVPRETVFTPEFARLYTELRAMERGPFRSGKYYGFAGDLREYGFQVRLNLFCRMDKEGNHKLEMIDVGTMRKDDILREVAEIFRVDPLTLGLMRVDFAVDVAGLPLQWFRQTVRANHKRFRAAVTGERFYSEMGNGDIQTLYFGKRPNVIRIYDKRAEYAAQYQRIVRKHGKDTEPPTFEETFGFTYPDADITRVERQLGARIPKEISTLRNVCTAGFHYEPFAGLKIIDHDDLPARDASETFETFCTGRYLHDMATSDGMQVVKTFLSRETNGNAGWAWKKYARYLPAASSGVGITSQSLQERFMVSLAKQMGHV